MFENLYDSNIKSTLQEEFLYPNHMMIPKLAKVSLNIGLGEASSDYKVIAAAVKDLSLIAGQKAVPTYATRSIAGFKIREGMPIGCKVTLRRKKMFIFLEKLVYIALPRERDFTGISKKSFDGNGNCSFGIKEHIIFPEIHYDHIYKIFGLDVNIVTTTSSDLQSLRLLSCFGLPFRVS